jgi:hypothetical protein
MWKRVVGGGSARLSSLLKATGKPDQEPVKPQEKSIQDIVAQHLLPTSSSQTPLGLSARSNARVLLKELGPFLSKFRYFRHLSLIHLL